MDSENSDTSRTEHARQLERELNSAKAEQENVINGITYDLTVKIDELRRQNERLREALREVLSHRKEDKDGNHVMWIGEGTFLKCEQALSNET